MEDGNDLSWRLGIAEKATLAYAQDPNLVALCVAGSVGAGLADRFSDVELDCYWLAPPTEQARRAPVSTLGGRRHIQWPYDDEGEEWSDDFELHGVQIGVSGFLASSIEETIDDVLERFDTDVIKQLRLAAIERSVVLHGRPVIERWRSRIGDYPDPLVDAMLAEVLDIDRLVGWRSRSALVERGDHLALHSLLVRMEEMVLDALFALNRRYRSHPLYKWQRASIAAFEVTPKHLADRLDAVWTNPPTAALDEARRLLTETAHLAATQRKFDARSLIDALGEGRREVTGR